MHNLKLFIYRKYSNREQFDELCKGLDVYGYIYVWENLINGKMYVGQTVRLDIREKQHLRNDNNQAIDLAIEKYGDENFDRYIIDVAFSKEELDEKERYWISYYDTFEGKGYNCNSGGGGNGKPSNKTRRKMSNSSSIYNNAMWDEYIKVVLVETNELIGIYENNYVIVDTLKSVKGKKLDRRAITCVLKNIKNCKIVGGYTFQYCSKEEYEEYLKIKDTINVDEIISHVKPFIKVINKKTSELIGIYESKMEIAKSVKSINGKKLDAGHIGKALNCKLQSHGGYIYQYCSKEEYEAYQLSKLNTSKLLAS